MPIRQKRSLTPGSIPTTASLVIGELAMNVPDGRIFFRRSGSGSDTVQSVITTGAQNSGSVTLTGSLSIFNSAGSALEISGDIMEFTGSLIITGSAIVTGSLRVTSGITGSLLGTASTASFVTTAQTASFVTTAQTASFVTTAQTASFVTTAQTASFIATASFANNADLLDGAHLSILATTGSNTFIGNQIITGSVTISGSITNVGFILNTGSITNTGSLTIRSGGITINTGSLVINSGSITVNTNGDSRVFASTFRPVGGLGQNLYIGHAGTTNVFNSGTDAFGNTSVGVSALDSNTTGYGNTAVGRASLDLNRIGNENTAVGYNAGNGNFSGSNNVAIGSQTFNSYDGWNSVAVGALAGFNINSSLVTGSIYLGYNALASNGALNAVINNEIVIGSNNTGLGSNTVVLGNSSITTTVLRGNVGIGITSPSAPLHVVGAVSASAFTGSLFGTASFATSASWAPSTGGSVTVADEGTTQGTATYFNFIGTGVTAAITSNTASITIPGAGGSAFPYTGSAAITGSLVLTGSFEIGPAEFNATSSATTAGTTIVSTYATGSANSAFYNYYISSGSNARAGQIMSVWSGSSIQYTEVTTNDLGNTNAASFAVTLATGNVRLSFTSTGIWTVRSIVNLL